jgi:hypothetical protein
MNDNEPINSGGQPRRPAWNKGKLGRSRRCGPVTFGAFGQSSKSQGARVTSHCSILQSTASCAAAM